MKYNRFMNFFIPNTKIYLWIIFILSGIIFIYNKTISLIMGLLLIYLIYYNWRSTHISKEKWKELVEKLSIDIDAATQKILLELPIPMVILKNNRIIWYNGYFLEIFEEKNILDQKIHKICPSLDVDSIKDNSNKNKPIRIKLDERTYEILSNHVEEEDMIILYWIDVTPLVHMKKIHEENRPIFAYIQIDNYDEVMESTPENNKSLVSAIIDRKINSWASEIDAFIKKFDSDKYIMIFENKHLDLIEEKRLDILDVIREIQSGNKIPITLSIGIGTTKENLSVFKYQQISRSALDIALARGGDQAVIKKNEKIYYYGGKTQAKEKRTKVKARVIAHGLKELIQNSDKIYIMGHTVPDLDSLGSALGIYRGCLQLEKEAFIVFKKSNPSIDVLYEQLLEEGYKDIFIPPETAKRNATENTLMVIVDTQSKVFVEDSTLLDVVEKIIVIDHHRRSAEYIEGAVLTYTEPYASSASELVTELLQYLDDKVTLTTLEANALLAGIFIDTKYFTFKTGVRTFEAASFLRRKGADTIACRQLFKDDINTFAAKAETVKNAEIVNNNIAISVVEENSPNANIIVAQSADELLNIKNIIASFVMASVGGEVFISGRSLGNINVQVILEKLGGGGHLTVAGAQLPNVTVDEAKTLLKNTIMDYLKEGEIS